MAKLALLHEDILNNQSPLFSERMQSSNQIDFYLFNEWATQNLNVYSLLEVFELVPSPSKEHDVLYAILEDYESQHGDNMLSLIHI